MIKNTLSVAPQASMRSSSIAGLVWLAAVVIPLFISMSSMFHWGPATIAIGVVIILNASVGAWWAISGVGLFIGGAASSAADVMSKGGSVSEDDPDFHHNEQEFRDFQDRIHEM